MDMSDQTAAGGASATLDISRIDVAEAEVRAFPLPARRIDGFQVVIRQSVLNEMSMHGQATPDVEICGVVVGKLYQDERGPFLYLEGSIRGDHAQGQVAQVTFTSQTWDHIHKELETRYPKLRIAGWYHTHPGFGIFLSAMDKFIHNNFFSVVWQVAHVYDPLSGEDGMFLWKAGEPVNSTFLIEPDAEAVPRTVRRAASRDLAEAASTPPSTETLSEAGDPLLALEKRIVSLERNQQLNVVLLTLIILMQTALAGWIWYRSIHGGGPMVSAQESPASNGNAFATENGHGR